MAMYSLMILKNFIWHAKFDCTKSQNSMGGGKIELRRSFSRATKFNEVEFGHHYENKHLYSMYWCQFITINNSTLELKKSRGVGISNPQEY